MISTDKEKDELRENMPVQFKEKEQLKKGTKDNQVGYFQRSQNLAKKPGNSVSSTVAATQTATGTYNYAAAPVADAKVTTITSGEDADATILNDKKKEGKYKEVAATTPKVIADDNIKTEKNDGFVSGNTQNGADKSENNRFVNNNSANNTNVPVTLNKNAESSKKTTESDDNQRTRTLAGKTDLEKTNLKISSKNNKSKSRAKFASPQKAVPAYAQKVEAFDREKPKKDELDYRKDEQSELAKNKLSETVATKTEALTETAVIGGTAESQTKESAVNEVPILADETTLASGLTNVDSVYTAVDEMPQYPGGDSELLKYFKNNIKQSEGKNESSTKMYVQFTINKNGKAVNPNVLKNTDKELEKSVIDAVNKMPAWKPGKQNGKVVDVKYSLPIQVSGN